MDYPFGDNIEFRGHYQHSLDGEGDILFRMYGFHSWTSNLIEALHYLQSVLDNHPLMAQELSRSPLAVALFFGEKGVDIVYTLPRDGWQGNGSLAHATYVNGEKTGSMESGGEVLTCEAGSEIAVTELVDFRRRFSQEAYREVGFRDYWPDLPPIVNRDLPIIDFDSY